MKSNLWRSLRQSLWFLVPLLLASCTADDGEQLNQLISERNIPAVPQADLPIPGPDEALSRLGRHLFFTRQLSGDADVACVSCHHPFAGGDEDLSLAVGIKAENPELFGRLRTLDVEALKAIKPGHQGIATMPRNVPTDFAVSYYRKALFWDGRVRFDTLGGDGSVVTPDSLFATPDNQVVPNDLLFAQTRFPVTNPDEMLGFMSNYPNNDSIRQDIEGRLRGHRDDEGNAPWLEAFREGFDAHDASAEEVINFANISRAITAYIRSKDFIHNSWSRYLEGDEKALSEQQQRGALLFFQGGGQQNCADCHKPPFFTDEQYHNLAIPQIGPGMDKLDADYGRKRVTRASDDQFRFRTPSLLNVEHTAPYSHSGAYDTLFDVIWHHIEPEKSVAEFDYELQHLDQFEGTLAADEYPHMKANTEMALALARERGDLPMLDYSRDEVHDLIAFLQALTDPCIESEACMSDWMPEEGDYQRFDLLEMTLSDPDGRPVAKPLFTD
ncbi:MAG: cytochrome-c peroxidase [Pseudomonadota bacterium]